LLHELAADSQHGSIKELLGTIFEERLEAAALSRQPFLLDGVLDLGDFLLDDLVVGVRLACVW
jgi:hypothetical protein